MADILAYWHAVELFDPHDIPRPRRRESLTRRLGTKTVQMISLTAGEPLPPKSEERARVVATFIRDGRLVTIPAQYKKRRFIMEEIARSFEWGRLYDEKEVNTIMRTFHDDVASLRREMIDQRIMMRENGRYWLLRPHD